MKSPRRHPRLVAAMLITVLSIALAEVSIGSSPWGLLNPLQWILLVPVYGCQVLLIATLVLRRQPRPSLSALWSAGAVMGLYEFYITRVLWGTHDWNTPGLVAGVDVYALIVVAGLWHPFMAFIFPLMLAEQVLVREPHIAGLFARRGREGTGRARAGLLWAGIVVAGLVSGGMLGMLGSPLVVVASLVGSALVVWAALWLAGRGAPAESWEEVLPSRRGMTVLIVVLTLLFGVFALDANTDGGVPVWQQAAAWVLYGAFIWLAARNLRLPGPMRVVRFAGPRAWRWRAVGFVGVAVLVSLVPFAAFGSVFVIWGLGAAVALGMFAWAVRGAVLVGTPVAA